MIKNNRRTLTGTGRGTGQKVSPTSLRRSVSPSIRRNMLMTAKIRKLLQRACPGCPEQLASGMAIDLTDILFIGERHKKHVQELLRFSFPRDKARFSTLLARDVEVDLLFENEYHLRSLKKLLPRFWKTLDSGSRKNRAKK